MAQTPQRPFVPPAAPAMPRESARQSGEFNVARPFVHGVPLSQTAAPPATAKSTRALVSPARPPDIPPSAARAAPPPLPLVYDPPRSPERAMPGFAEEELGVSGADADTLAPIQDFLHTESAQRDELVGINEYSYEQPPVEHFTDQLADESAFGSPESEPAMSEDIMDPLEGSAEWGEAEWQQFDWRSAAALGEAGDPAASDAWLDTDWDKPPGRPGEKRESAAKAIADALDGIARRIREGDLALPSTGAGATPADIAATLAALLGGKRQAG